MKNQFVIGSNESFVEGNVYADKSAIVLDWILQVGLNKDQFTIREVTRDRKISIGLVQRVFEVLIMKGLLHTAGVRTSKRFFLKDPKPLLRSWLDNYSIVRKCKMWTYKTGFSEKAEVLKVLEDSNLNQKVALALHSAAEVYGCKNTNLQTLELYLMDPTIRSQLEKILLLEPQERGYEVLLIEPYYKSLLRNSLIDQKAVMIPVSPALLTFLDLYHFPLRGHEQAEFMSERKSELKKIYMKDQ